MNSRRLLGMVVAVAVVAVPLAAQQGISEEDYDAAMKTIRATVGGVRDQLQANDASALAASGTTLVEEFTKAEAFWRGREEEPAIELAARALAQARRFQEAASAGDTAAARDSFQEVRGTCQPCHEQYREELPDGSYRIKQGGAR